MSLTPRQRIVMFRQLQQLFKQQQTAETKAKIKHLTEKFNYLGIETCAATGLCEQECPVGINTGDLIRELRGLQHQQSSSVAKWSSDHFALSTRLAKATFSMQNLFTLPLPNHMVNGLGRLMHKVTKNKLPLWSSSYPTPSKSRLSATKISDDKVIFMPSCSSRVMGTQASASDQRSLNDVTISLLEKAGYQVLIPKQQNELCCGMPYNSQGLTELAGQKSQQLEQVLTELSEQGDYAILMDASPCKQFSDQAFTDNKLSIYEPFEFIEQHLLDRLSIQQNDETIMLHITCSSQKMGLSEKILNVANRCASEVIIPEDISCCGWAGNKGFTTPELNASALKNLKQQIPAQCRRGFSNSLTCEIGLSQHGGIPYQSILYLLDEVSAKT